MLSVKGLLVFAVLCMHVERSVTTKRRVCIYDDRNLCSNCTSSHHIQDGNLSLNESGLTIQFCSEVLLLNHVIEIEHQRSVSLLGLPEMNVTLDCSTVNTSGLLLDNLTDIEIRHLSFQRCGLPQNITVHGKCGDRLTIKVSIFIKNSFNVRANRIRISFSQGIGLWISNTFGTVAIENSIFENNNQIPKENKSGGGGIYIELANCSSNDLQMTNCNGKYKISNCIFKHNNATRSKKCRSLFIPTRGSSSLKVMNGGGGLCFHLRERVANNTITISECEFRSNSATWGGGMYLIMQDSVVNNSALIKDTNFTDNTSPSYGGGGADFGFISFPYYKKGPKLNDNKIQLDNCKFESNNATYGGGVAFYASQSLDHRKHNNVIIFNDCTWKKNRALFGSAVDLSSHIFNEANGRLPKPKFTDCSFIGNSIINAAWEETSHTYHSKGKGTLLSVGYEIDFSGNINFHDNNGTALYLTSSMANFSRGSYVEFLNNTGFDGGAITLLGFSSLDIRDDSDFIFINNMAEDKGGAIMSVTINKKDLVATQSCFIHYAEKNNYTQSIEDRNINFSFENNSAGVFGRNIQVEGHYGHSIFAASLVSCYKRCDYDDSCSYDQTFDCIANFTFVNRTKYEISTWGKQIKLRNGTQTPLKFIPGEFKELPIVITDDLSNEVGDFYHVHVKNINGSHVMIELSDAYISENWIKFFGEPGDMAEVTIETTRIREVGISFQIEMNECPPGYVKYWTKKKEKTYHTCICSASTSNKRYSGIYRCNDTEHTAFLKRGYWIGYHQKGNHKNKAEYGKEENLLSGYCPRGYCFTNKPTETGDREYTLPNSTSIHDLDIFICGPHRTGVLCGRCVKNRSSYYHSTTYKCRDTDKCKWGWLFYLLSEILPVTTFFIVIMLCDIKLTTGAFNAVVYFAQISEALLITANGLIVFPSITYGFVRFNHFITRMFNLNFFAMHELSFCLWEGAQTLDLLIFKYVTIIYALFLVLFIITVMRCCTCTSRFKLLSKLRGKRNPKNTIIHGLTGFLVMCYSECTRISLLLLTPTPLENMSKDGNNIVKNVVFYNGELTFFKGTHLYYALPALFFLITFGIIPPVLLISYPLCYRVFALLKISETKFVSIICKCIPLETFRPFFDSFQSTFKDKYRFFAGLYFIYRLTTLLSFAFMRNLTEFYLMIQAQLILILAIHTITRPYKKAWHNAIDGIIFMIMAIINAMTIFNYKHATELLDYQETIHVITKIQTTLLYVPLLYIFIYIALNIFWKLKLKKSMFKKRRNEKVVKKNEEREEVSVPVIMNRMSLGDDFLDNEYHYRALTEEDDNTA